MNILSETDKAYIAGFFDGEGCVGYYNASRTNPKRPSYFHVSVSVCNTDPRVIRWIYEAVGVGKIGQLKLNSTRRRPAYQWQLGQKAAVLEFLQTVRPYLKNKADQVDVVLAHYTFEAGYVQRHGSVTSDVVRSRQATSDTLKSLKRAVFAEGVETKQAGTLVN